jgi:predicted SAM-dependent methyltransferase
VSIHALQEVPSPEIVPVLQELRRVLKPRGALRLCLQDLDRALAAYQHNDRDYFLIPDDDARSIRSKLIIQLLWYGYSRTLFTHDFIEELLVKAGFSQVTRCAYKQTASAYAETTALDNRENESPLVEAVK